MNSDREKLEIYSNYLNSFIGMGALGFAIGISGTPAPGLFSIVTCIMLWKQRNHIDSVFPELISKARKIRDENKDNQYLKGRVAQLESLMLNWRDLFNRNLVYTLGTTSFIIVMIWGIGHDISFVWENFKTLLQKYLPNK